MITKKYQLINNIGGWVVFIIALLTYWLTLEPTASYWDCGEFIIQADKLEVGHPPGNPIFMLTARFFVNFASSPESVALMVNAMSGLLSALTILLLFWTISHLVRRLVVKDNQQQEISLRQYLIIMGSAAVGALAYCWSDTFWFSAVEGEVYAFSSFCTALVFWLILKWENRADQPGSDRWLILIAYIIGVSIAVHLLNLLCIPAIVLVFAYRKYKNMDVLKSLLALGISFLIIFFVLYGLVPGFIKTAQTFELACVNGLGMSFNSGAIIYAFTTLAVFCWTLYEYWRNKSNLLIGISTTIAITLSGMLFIGSSPWLGIVLTLALIYLLFFQWRKKLPTRWLNLAMWSIAVIFIGYSSYALILIRSSADTPMNQNSPDNVFDLASYLNREQYGENPLLYGRTLYSGQMHKYVGAQVDTLGFDENQNPYILSTPIYDNITNIGKPLYVKGLNNIYPKDAQTGLNTSDIAKNMRLAERGKDYYAKTGYDITPKNNPELDMIFPRIYSPMHTSLYGEWVRLDTVPDNIKTISAIDESTNEKVPEFDTSQEPTVTPAGTIAYPQKTAYKPTYAQNLTYFFNYQLNHMYMRYFMWNFAGRQNDYLNQHGELDAGNWISGISFIDNPRLGDQSLLPDTLGKDNAGHNVYFMLPLILGIIGLLWQAFAGRRGIEQFWVIFFLFFMTGIAIVLYLNQPPGQPRERDYAFAGSFYAFAIWIGMGVPGLWRMLLCIKNKLTAKDKDKSTTKIAQNQAEEIQPDAIINEPDSHAKESTIFAIIAAIIGIFVPLQMVSQTWDDHDRSGRYAARDYGINYLESLEPNAIVFCNGDNDTFPLWYAQEVEGVRTDVKVINLSYLASDWYANQQGMPSYDAKPVKFTLTPENYAYGAHDVTLINNTGAPMTVLDAIKSIAKGNGVDKYGYPVIDAQYLTIPVDRDVVLKRGLVAPEDTAAIQDQIIINIANASSIRSKRFMSLSELLMLDIIATNAQNGWERPIYWCSTVGPEYHLGLTPYLRLTGATHQLVPTIQEGMPARADRAYNVVTKKFRWGGADAPDGKTPYFDETARRMLYTMRSAMLETAEELIFLGDRAIAENDPQKAKQNFSKAKEVLTLLDTKLPDRTDPFGLALGVTRAQLYCELGQETRLNDKAIAQKGLKMLENLMNIYTQYVIYNQAMCEMFINPSLTSESKLIPYQFYHFVELYKLYGGDDKKLQKDLEKKGINLELLKKQYDGYTNAISSGSSNSGGSQDYVTMLVQYAEVVNTVAKLSAEEYSKCSAEEREVDSMFHPMLQTALDSKLVSLEELNKYEQFKNVDMARSKRIGQEYLQAHPELTE